MKYKVFTIMKGNRSITASCDYKYKTEAEALRKWRELIERPSVNAVAIVVDGVTSHLLQKAVAGGPLIKF